MPLQGSLSIERMCQLAGVSRAGFYRSLQDRAPVEEEMEVRSVIQQIAVEHRRRYGYRRISAELRRRGMLVNHKRVSRIMREDNQSDVGSNSSGERPKSRPPAHRSDESPAGYSSASCSPAELASASPAEGNPEREEKE